MQRVYLIAFAVTAGLPLGTEPVLAQNRLPQQLNVENLRAANLSSLEILDGEGKVIARLARPVAAGKKSVIRLQRATGCDMTVQARFDDEGEVDETLNLCRERVLRFRD